jgi:hypothetical protein
MRQRESSKGAWPVLLTALAGVVLFGAAAYLLQPPAADAALERFFLSGPPVRHCGNCGWIEAKRELPPLAGDPHAMRIYEYTLRMPNGSMSVFQETLPTSWRLGERVMLIEATEALD